MTDTNDSPNEISVEDLIGEINGAIEECAVMAHITRDSDLQRKACDRLEEIMAIAGGYRAQAVIHQFENEANLFLGFMLTALALRCQICMWIYLKKERPDEAWECLVLSQRYADLSINAHPSFKNNEKFRYQMEQIEELVFPPQVFFSAGYVIQKQICSICNQDYGDCDHIAGRPYMGEFCAIRAEGLEFDHAAVVKEPSDKRCRAVHYRTNGGKRNRMTWKIEPLDESESTNSDDDSMIIHAVVAVASDASGKFGLHRPWLAKAGTANVEDEALTE